jgi:hypothetical protein
MAPCSHQISLLGRQYLVWWQLKDHGWYRNILTVWMVAGGLSWLFNFALDSRVLLQNRADTVQTVRSYYCKAFVIISRCHGLVGSGTLLHPFL